MGTHRHAPTPPRRFRLAEAIEIDATAERVYDRWRRYEDFPRFMESVRRIKCIDERRLLWDVDILGHQMVWEARIVEAIPEKLVRWESSWGAATFGEVRFDPRPGGRTRLTVEIAYQPRGLLERLGARLGLPAQHVRRDLALFRKHVESDTLEDRPGR